MTVPSPLATRMKVYESATGAVLPDNSWAVLRLDGKAFHTYTRDLDKPFDQLFMLDMGLLMNYLCSNISGAVFGYTQSDEISIIMHDLSRPTHQHWFGGKVQKIVSVAASYAGAYWNWLRESPELAVFDARVFTLPSSGEVKNYLLWRQLDSMRNAMFLAANAVYSHKELLGKSYSEKRAMLKDAGVSWDDDYSDREKLGTIAGKIAYSEEVKYTHKQTGEQGLVLAERSAWVNKAATSFKDFSSPIFRFLQPEEQLCQMSEFLS